MVLLTSHHRGTPGLAHEGSRDQTNKMADARGRRNMAAASASLGASPHGNGVPIGCRVARHHRTGRGLPNMAPRRADVSVTTPGRLNPGAVWSGEARRGGEGGGAFHSAGLLTSHTHTHTQP